MTESLSEGNVHNHPSSLTQPCHTSEAAAVHRPAADSEGSHAPCEAESPPAAHHNPGDDGEHVIEAQQQSLPEEAKVQVRPYARAWVSQQLIGPGTLLLPLTLQIASKKVETHLLPL